MSRNRVVQLTQNNNNNSTMMDAMEYEDYKKQVNFAIYTRELCAIPANAYYKAAEEFALYGTLYPSTSSNGHHQMHMNGSGASKKGRKIYQNTAVTLNSMPQSRTHGNCKPKNKTSNKPKRNTQYPLNFQSNSLPLFFLNANRNVNSAVTTQWPQNELRCCQAFSCCAMNQFVVYPPSFSNYHWCCPFQMFISNNVPRYWSFAETQMITGHNGF